MSRAITDVGTLARYIRGVLERAEHHAGAVDAVSLTIAGAVLWRADAAPVVREQQGRLKNVLWVVIAGNRYALSYNHRTGTIDIRAGGLRGRAIASFTNADSASRVKRFFAGL